MLWQNPLPSSTKYCRPIKVIFHKETAEFTRKFLVNSAVSLCEVDEINTQIKKLMPTNVQIENQMYSVHYKLLLTTIDGKFCSTLSYKFVQKCHICAATPKMMNDLDEVRRRPFNERLLAFGLSSLHAWIKYFECLTHISYRLDIKTWQIQQANKAVVEIRKKEIQRRFREEMSVVVDIRKQGYGSANDGNTARIFFSKSADSFKYNWNQWTFDQALRYYIKNDFMRVWSKLGSIWEILHGYSIIRWRI